MTSTPPEHVRSQRQLKVGEELRHAIAEFFMYYSFYDGVMKGKSVTISEVRVSPDLKNATVFATVLGGEIPKGFVKELQSIAYEVKRHIAKNIRLRNMPALYFKTDEQFAHTNHIEALIEQVIRQPSLNSDSEK